jgi:hypothetical protein
MKKIVFLIVGCILCTHYGYSQSTVSTSDLTAFENPGENWSIVSDLVTDFNKSNAKFIKGTGIIVNTPSKEPSNLVSKTKLDGIFEVDFDFLTTKGSSSAVYLLGRYKIQLSDSWPEIKNPLGRIGVISANSPENNNSYQVHQPINNVGKAPGLWQHLKVKFKSPTFDSSGKRIDKARFEEVYLNGVLIHQAIEVDGLSDGASFNDESASGPLVFQADDKHFLAFRNINIKTIQETPIQQLMSSAPEQFRLVDPIIVKPETEPYVLRSYLLFENDKRTHVISVGNPNHTNYSYDLKQGAILQFWRGGFVDATEMWHSRGEPQLATPLGAVTILSSAPSFARLDNSTSLWPDSIPFDDFHNKGYSLDANKNLVFQYEYAGFHVADKIAMEASGESLKREINVTNAPQNLYFRIASGNIIESLGKGLYVIDGKSYYIKVGDGMKPVIRRVHNAEELVMPVSIADSSFEYSIIW